MKRFFLSLTAFLALWIFSFVGFSVQAASGYTYPPHLNGDPNYTLAYGHMGVGTYVDTKAVKVLDQSNKGVVFAVRTVSGLVLDRNNDWVVPAKDTKEFIQVFIRVYDDPWNIAYLYDYSKSNYKAVDLSSPYGYMQSAIGGFSIGWHTMTGTYYPNLRHY